MSADDWLYLGLGFAVIIGALMYGIECIRYANGIIDKCRRVRKEYDQEDEG